MPECPFMVRWPDATCDLCYSPSTVIEHHLEASRSYSVRAFLDASAAGLRAASDRVRQVYGGSRCSRAEVQLAALQAKACRFAETEIVLVESVGRGVSRSA